MKKLILKFGSLFLAFMFIFTLLAPTYSVFASEETADSDELVDIIVRYEETVPDTETLDPSYKNVRTLDFLPIQTMTVPASAVKEISRQKGVRRVSYDQEMTTSEDTEVSSRALTDNDWNNEMVGAFDAWDENITGTDIKVAVIDTGFYNHPDITYAGGYSIFDENHKLGADDWRNDHDGHGTHVAGIIGASTQSPVRGIAPGASIYGIKVYHKTQKNSTSASNLLLGIQEAVKMGVDIINISSGFQDPNQDIHDAIISATNAGILVVAASGNGTGSSGIDYPAAYPEAVAVANVDRNRTIASDSKVSLENELAAPGRSINSLSNTGSGYAENSGTSQATPHVAGIAALLMQKQGTRQVRSLLQKNATDLGPEGRDDRYGFGLVRYSKEVPIEEEPTEDTPEETVPEETEPVEEIPSEEVEEEPETEQPQEEVVETPTESEQPSTEPETESPSESTDVPEETIPEETPDNEEAASEEEEQPVDVSENAVWIRPSESDGTALLSKEDFASVADNGVIAVSFDATMESVDQLSLTAEQVLVLRERNISILIAKLDMEWLIPSSNFQEGETVLRFSNDLSQEVSSIEEAKSPLYQMNMIVNGASITEFESNMTYRFFSAAAEENQDHLYLWSNDQEEWIILDSTYKNGAVVSDLNAVGTLGVFSPVAFEETEEEQEDIGEETEVDEEETDEEAVMSEETPTDEDQNTAETEDAEANQAGVSDSVNIPKPAVIIGVVTLASFGGGFYFFGGKQKIK
ncbi:S8 family peptidase [Marinilactibacillus sp. XAAS-LB27]|uniref:S8 family peptidase n=1 Tax=Marinilactibacillus sp. XAAS-LB27 TaxID=3114538 RepID=UPI002E175A21|nr:S8 family peptidase [Marinilactibacillus sp. XAAS-LB27]